MTSLGSDEGFRKERALCGEQCACGRGIPQGQWVYRRADGAKRCLHCQLRARSATMTDAEHEEILERILRFAFAPDDEEAKEENDGL